MNLAQATIEMTQADLESAIQELLPAGYVLRHLHVTEKGATTTLMTPWVTADLSVRLVDQDVQGTSRWRVQVSKWLPIPGAVVSAILRGVTAHAPQGISAEGDCLMVRLPDLLSPHVRARAYDLGLAPGLVRLCAQGVEVGAAGPISQNRVSDAKDGIA